MNENRFSVSKINSLIIYIFLIFFGLQTIFAFEISEAEVFEKQKEAEELSKKWSGETVRRSISLYLEAAENWEKLSQPKRAAETLRESARLALRFLDFKTAFTSLERALKIDEKLNDTDGKIISLSLLSDTAREKGEIEKSQNYYQQAISLSEKSTNAIAKAHAFYSAGRHNVKYGDNELTLEFLEKALVFANQTENKSLTAEIHRILRWAYARKGDNDKALENANKSLEISNAAQDEREKTLSYYSIGFHYVLIDQKQLAYDYLKKAETNFPDDIDLLYKAEIYTTIGYIYEIYGESDIAESYYQKALEIYQKIEYETGILTCFSLLGDINELKGERSRAFDFYNKALKLAIKLKNDVRVGYIKSAFGNIALSNGDYDRALGYYNESLAINEKLKIELPQIQNSLAKAFEMKGELKLAQENYQKALERNLKVKDYSLATVNLHNLAKLSITTGEIDKAFEYSNESIRLTESLYANVDNNKLRRTFLSTIYDRYSLNINLLMKMHERFPDQGYALKALQTSEKSRSRLLLENLRLSEAEFTADADPQLVGKEKEIRNALNENAEKLTQVLTSGANAEEIKKIEDKINELKNELEIIKGELRSKSPIYSEIKNPQDFELTEFQKNVLDDDSLFLEFSFGENESYLWLIEKNNFAVVTLPKRQILEESLDEIYDLLVSRELLENESNEAYAKRINDNEEKFQQKAQVLSNHLFGKIADKLKDKRLIIAADGKLRYFPVSALPFPSEHESSAINEPLLLTNEVVYEPSAATLSLLERKSNAAKTPAKDILVFADPVYSLQDERMSSLTNEFVLADSSRGSSDDLSGQTSSLQRLPATAQEAESIMQIFGESSTKLLTGFSANRENFFESNLSDYKVLHFATHGLLNENYPEFSGLVFSKFDANGNSKKGVVRLQDIYGLNLAADLVVLSACDTGIGKEIKGEGLISLTDGFLQAGAKTVISSRWKVSDKATLELMKKFYEIMESENLPPSKALQKAQIKLRQNPAFASPYHWAAFTIQGDYQHKPDFTGGFGFIKYLLILAFILALIGGYFLFKKFR